MELNVRRTSTAPSSQWSMIISETCPVCPVCPSCPVCPISSNENVTLRSKLPPFLEIYISPSLPPKYLLHLFNPYRAVRVFGRAEICDDWLRLYGTPVHPISLKRRATTTDDIFQPRLRSYMHRNIFSMFKRFYSCCAILCF